MGKADDKSNTSENAADGQTYDNPAFDGADDEEVTTDKTNDHDYDTVAETSKIDDKQVMSDTSCQTIDEDLGVPTNGSAWTEQVNAFDEMPPPVTNNNNQTTEAPPLNNKLADPLPPKNDVDGDLDDDDDEDDGAVGDDFQSRFWRRIYDVSDDLTRQYNGNRVFIKRVIAFIFLAGYAAYLVYASIYDLEEAAEVLIITGIVVFCAMYVFVRDTVGETIYEKALEPFWDMTMKLLIRFKWLVALAVVAAIAIGLYFLTRDNPIQLISFSGLVFFVLFLYVFSKYPHRVKWRPVLWGLALQFIFGLLILRTYPGYVFFRWLGDVVQAFLSFSAAGSEFLYGENYMEHYFAFAVLPIVIYFSSFIAVLYYWGTMQVIIEKIAWLMQRTMKTSASESLNAAGNIFIGQTEAPLLIRPFLPGMTRSEIHAVMTGGFATIAGSVMGAYILSGIDAAHLISASVMSAPAALAVAKLFYPETKVSPTAKLEDISIPKGEERNFIEAASNGASTAIPLVLNIAANLIAFLSLLALLNALLGYFGGLVGYPELTFELICSYVFMPIAFIMGVEWADCQDVAELIGIKTFINEFVAYDKLAILISNREAGIEPSISERSEVIATYALCGFANIGSIGIQLGGLTPLAPSKKADLAAVAVRALIAGTVACFMTACIAGVLYVPEDVSLPANATEPSKLLTLY